MTVAETQQQKVYIDRFADTMHRAKISYHANVFQKSL